MIELLTIVAGFVFFATMIALFCIFVVMVFISAAKEISRKFSRHKGPR